MAERPINQDEERIGDVEEEGITSVEDDEDEFDDDDDDDEMDNDGETEEA